jgi:hypothetical protein
MLLTSKLCLEEARDTLFRERCVAMTEVLQDRWNTASLRGFRATCMPFLRHISISDRGVFESNSLVADLEAMPRLETLEIAIVTWPLSLYDIDDESNFDDHEHKFVAETCDENGYPNEAASALLRSWWKNQKSGSSANAGTSALLADTLHFWRSHSQSIKLSITTTGQGFSHRFGPSSEVYWVCGSLYRFDIMSSLIVIAGDLHRPLDERGNYCFPNQTLPRRSRLSCRTE